MSFKSILKPHLYCNFLCLMFMLLSYAYAASRPYCRNFSYAYVTGAKWSPYSFAPFPHWARPLFLQMLLSDWLSLCKSSDFSTFVMSCTSRHKTLCHDVVFVHYVTDISIRHKKVQYRWGFKQAAPCTDWCTCKIILTSLELGRGG